jgi:hypothetical protein
MHCWVVKLTYPHSCTTQTYPDKYPNTNPNANTHCDPVANTFTASNCNPNTDPHTFTTDII